MRGLLLVAVVASSSACAPRIWVNVLKPATVNLGPVKKLTVLEAQGRKTARDELMQELVTQARASGYFTIADRSEEGITVRVNGNEVLPSAPPAPDEIGVRLDVIDWNADKESQPTREKDKQGNPINKELWKSRVKVLVTAFNVSGKVFLVEKEYAAAGDDEKDEDAAIMNAARDVVSRLLEDITPQYAQKAIQFDDTEEAQRPVIDLARDGQVPKAIDTEKALLAKSPNNAAAIFNLAVLLDAQGLYRDALGLYEQAIGLAPQKPLYKEVKAECQARLADAEALAN